MKDKTMSSYKHVLKERDYKGSADDERNRRKGSAEDERNRKKNKDKNSNTRHTSHSHKSRRSNSPSRNSHRRKSPLKSKIGYDNSEHQHHRNRKHRESEVNESYEELSRRKRKLESELRALDLEEAAEREAENKKARKEEKVEIKKEPEEKIKSSSKADDSSKKSSKHSAENVAVKVEKERNKSHSSKLSESDKSDKKWGKTESKPESKDLNNKEKPNFEVSGKLAEETNTYNGIVIKYNEPAEARKPKRKWRLYPFKGDSNLPFIPIHRQSAYLFGRTRLIADIPIDHPSCSKQHAVLQFRLVPYKREDGTTGRRVKPYIIDLESSNGTFVNNQKVEPRRYVELVEKDVVKFGYSSREYVLLHEESKNDDDDDDGVSETND